MKYEVWAMKLTTVITNNDMNIWKVIQNGNSLKRTEYIDLKGHYTSATTTAEETNCLFRGNQNASNYPMHQSIHRRSWADFHYMDDAVTLWNAVKQVNARVCTKVNDKSSKNLSAALTTKAKPEDEDINLKFLRALPSSWSQLKTLEVDIKGYSTFSSSQSAGPNNSAFVSATSANRKMSYVDSPSYSSSTYTVPSNSKTGSQRSGNVIEDVLQSFVADTEPE
ncbi:hypothetical protein Tco_0238710 [Tanacetum coccineum]